MKRYFSVRAAIGADGRPMLVSDPHNTQIVSPPRFLGVVLKDPLPKAEDSIGLVDNYEAAEQIVEDHPDVRRAVAKRMLISSEPVVAKDKTAAAEALARIAVAHKEHVKKQGASKAGG